ncbi:outer membrane beta-barrel protein [Helicobacter pylori]|uniref:Hop family adhesin SabA n=1 Tax=Helicobacter pylori TaxID=210 RepID=UPI00165BF513|nr:SabA family sialic acid-binding adhesin [Helicobacter pylori]WQS20776.1 outer membrane beta-barrel protein [Helicobacter pylori]WQS30117.1 outer membrane beta-barrel protein [Helicobacter pylori]
MKKKFMAFTLGALLSSALNAEDNGYFVSAGYQIGQATQIAKNTGAIQKLSDTYENLNNLLGRFNTLNWAINNASDATSINNAISTLNSSVRNLTTNTTTSPAYQAVSLALNAAVAMWQFVAPNIGCGNGSNGSNDQTFNNTPSGTTRCNRTNNVGVQGALYTNEYKKINDAYQKIQAVLKQGMAALKNGGNEVTVETLKNNTSSSGSSGTNSNDTKVKNDAETLLTNASTIIDTLKTQCPWLETSDGGKAFGETSTRGAVCSIFSNTLSTITTMIANANEVVKQTKNLNIDEEAKIQNPGQFNPFNTNETAFANKMFQNAQTQVKLLNLANEVANNFKSINATQRHAMQTCFGGVGGTGYNARYSGCAKLSETLNSLEDTVSYYGNQVSQAQTIANTLLNFSNRVNELHTTYKKIQDDVQAVSNTPNSVVNLSNLIATSTDKKRPEGIQTTYNLNQDTYNQMQAAAKELANNPFRSVGMISSQSNSGAMNGIGIQLGYKQFFGAKRNWGARYYGFVDYNHTYIKSSFFNSASDVWTYGVGTDALYNFINDKATNFLGKNNKLSVGIFGGIALAGTSWLNSQYVNLTTINNVYSSKINTANFQFLFNLGFRANLAKEKKNNHAIQHGVELGIKIPTINTNYYSFLGAKLEYRRLYSIYLNYVFAY